MPTYETLARFERDHDGLGPAAKRAFRKAVRQFVEDLERGDGFREGLRVKGVRGHRGVFEMTWADDGRATFEYGKAQQNGEPHIIWRRVGSHDIFRCP